jgi:tetratricopeptide (TPR) repeat protein
LKRVDHKQNPLYPLFIPVYTFFIPLFTLIVIGLLLDILATMFYIVSFLVILGSSFLYIAYFTAKHKFKKFSENRKKEEIPSKFHWVLGISTVTIGFLILSTSFNLSEIANFNLTMHFILYMVILVLGGGLIFIGINPLFSPFGQKFFKATQDHRKGKYDKAIERFQQLSEKSPMDTTSLNHLGHSYISAMQYEKALETFNKSLEIDPNSKDTLNGIGVLHTRQGKYDSAIEMFEKALQQEITYPIVRLFKGSMESINLIDDEIYLNLGKVYYEMGNYNKAKEACSQGVRFKFHTKELWDLLGDIYLKNEEYDKCMEVFERNKVKHPRFENIPYYLGLVHYRNKNLSKAVELFQESLDVETKKNPASRDLAKTYFDLKQYKKALKACKLSLRYFPEDPDIIKLRSEIYNAINKDKTSS